MTVVADEARIVVMLFDVVGSDIVAITVPSDSSSQVGESHVRISADPPISDQSEVPVVATGYLVIVERLRRAHRENISDARIFIDGK
jgi:hypothetical protein